MTWSCLALHFSIKKLMNAFPISYAVFYLQSFFEFTWKTIIDHHLHHIHRQNYVHVSLSTGSFTKNCHLIWHMKKPWSQPTRYFISNQHFQVKQEMHWCVNFIGIMHIINSFTALCTFLLVLDSHNRSF